MLTDLQARKARPKGQGLQLSDSGGLYLYVTRSGFKSWRLKYRFARKEKRLVFGPVLRASGLLSESAFSRESQLNQLGES